ncbi:hypothetical protein [Actinoplanes teichomyceticus]|uniref:hypothetical protein n=1 Tax=Actinoplanes teichomyceticus TaxID=1867 RepID=UPI000F0A1722|nr:hypothetical protein [Actinoplanes teichomyceticus]GIF11663.1 hypothetical protein Ate01nite_16950 [Actinoplanes teichomyceticus]
MANADQTVSVLHGIKALQTAVPFVAVLLAVLVLFLLYPLTDSKVTALVRETQQREAAEAAQPGA